MTLEVPEPFLKMLDLDGPNGQARALEMLALEAYREAKISRGVVGEILGKDFYETEEFLKAHNATQEISLEDYKADIEVARNILLHQ